MSIAQINLPLADNAGISVSAAHDALGLALASAFGGFTAWDAKGAWAHNGKLFNEPVRCYQVAFEPDARNLNARALRNLAIQAGKAARQISVYLSIDSAFDIIDLNEAQTEPIQVA